MGYILEALFFLWDIYIYIHTPLGQDRISCIPSWELQLYINKCAISIWAEVSGWLLIWVFAYHHNFSIYLALTPGLYSQHVVIFHVMASISSRCHEQFVWCIFPSLIVFFICGSALQQLTKYDATTPLNSQALSYLWWKCFSVINMFSILVLMTYLDE